MVEVDSTSELSEGNSVQPLDSEVALHYDIADAEVLLQVLRSVIHFKWTDLSRSPIVGPTACPCVYLARLSGP